MRKLTFALAGTAIAALVLSGCGAKEAGSPSNSSGGTEDIGTLSLLAQRIGEKSAAKQTTHLKMSVESAGETFTGEGDLRLGDSPAMDLKVAVPEMAELTMRLVDGVFYVKLPDELEPGKSWLKIDTAGSDPMSQALGAVVKQVKENGDPTQMLKQLEGAGEITAKKSEQLGGKDTTHYSITIDVKKMVEKQAASNPELKKAAEEMAKTGVQTLPLELWLDGENLPVRMIMDTPFTNPQTQKSERVKMTADYSDWGKSVEVAAPPAAEVAELPR